MRYPEGPTSQNRFEEIRETAERIRRQITALSRLPELTPEEEEWLEDLYQYAEEFEDQIRLSDLTGVTTRARAINALMDSKMDPRLRTLEKSFSTRELSPERQAFEASVRELYAREQETYLQVAGEQYDLAENTYLDAYKAAVRTGTFMKSEAYEYARREWMQAYTKYRDAWHAVHGETESSASFYEPLITSLEERKQELRTEPHEELAPALQAVAEVKHTNPLKLKHLFIALLALIALPKAPDAVKNFNMNDILAYLQQASSAASAESPQEPATVAVPKESSIELTDTPAPTLEELKANPDVAVVHMNEISQEDMKKTVEGAVSKKPVPKELVVERAPEPEEDADKITELLNKQASDLQAEGGPNLSEEPSEDAPASAPDISTP